MLSANETKIFRKREGFAGYHCSSVFAAYVISRSIA